MKKHKYILTKHAIERANERFPGYDIKQELENALPYGRQSSKSNSIALLSPKELVFIVENGVVLTILLKKMFDANMSIHMGKHSKNIVLTVKPKVTSENINQPLKEKTKEEILELVQKHLKQYSTTFTSEKERHKIAKDLGFNKSERVQYETMYCKMFAEKRSVYLPMC